MGLFCGLAKGGWGQVACSSWARAQHGEQGTYPDVSDSARYRAPTTASINVSARMAQDALAFASHQSASFISPPPTSAWEPHHTSTHWERRGCTCRRRAQDLGCTSRTSIVAAPPPFLLQKRRSSSGAADCLLVFPWVVGLWVSILTSLSLVDGGAQGQVSVSNERLPKGPWFSSLPGIEENVG